MRLPEQRWLRVAFFATALIFTSVAVYLYGFRFLEWIESDASVTGVLATKVIAAKLPVVDNWYYANGDVWLVAPHLLAVIPIAILGLGVGSLLVTVLVGFALELYAFTKVYARISGELWVGLFAAMVTMMAWSNGHVAFGYIQLAYGFLTMLCMVTFAVFATLAESADVRPIRWAAAGLLVAAIAAQNPTRTLVFGFAPIVAACAWPWRAFPLRRRLAIAAAAAAGFAVAFVTYRFVFARFVTFSYPRGHLDFAFVDVSGILHNLSFLAQGLVVLCGGGPEPSVMSIPAVLLVVGAFAFVIREVLSSRALGAMRFVAVATLGQLAVVLVPVVFGNLLVDIPSVRYVMPSLLGVLGVAAVLAVRTLGEATRWRKIAIGWLVAVPLTALVAVPDVRPPAPETGIWPDSVELDRIASEIVRRNLTHGYADVLAANLLTLQSGGTAMTCPVYFSDTLVPERWLTDTACYRKDDLPDRFFVVTYQLEAGRASVRKTFPKPPVERFTVGSTYEVSVYRTADVPLDWLELPLREDDRTAFPMHIAATHLQMKRGNASVESGRLVATGEPGTIIYGPYIKLPRGSYTVRWFGNRVDSPGRIKFFIAAEGKDVLADASLPVQELPAARGELVKLRFKLEAPRPAIEFAIRSEDGGRAALDEVVIERR
jgi:hypothetical protein